MRIAIELLVAAFLLLLMIATAYLGMLMNFLFVLLFAFLAIGVVASTVSLVRKRAYLGIWKRSEYPQARRYLLQAILRSCFWVSVGLTVYFSVITIKFSADIWRAVMFQLWGVVALLCFLEWLPSKRIPSRSLVSAISRPETRVGEPVKPMRSGSGSRSALVQIVTCSFCCAQDLIT